MIPDASADAVLTNRTITFTLVRTRPEGETVVDFLNFAKNAGMFVTGITDPWQFFCGNPKNARVPALRDDALPGYATLAGEVAAYNRPVRGDDGAVRA